MNNALRQLYGQLAFQQAVVEHDPESKAEQRAVGKLQHAIFLGADLNVTGLAEVTH